MGVYHDKRGSKSIILTPVIPFMHSMLSERLALLGSMGPKFNVSFVEWLMNSFNSYQEFTRYPGTRMPLICNTAFGFDFPKAHLPLMHYVGSLLMQTTPPLDKSLEDWLSTELSKTRVSFV